MKPTPDDLNPAKPDLKHNVEGELRFVSLWFAGFATAVMAVITWLIVQTLFNL